ncbi:hypothetical protein MTO96_011359 [Rhipicephalus appendiculatus]
MGAYYATPELTPEHEFAPEVVGVEHQHGTRVEIGAQRSSPPRRIIGRRNNRSEEDRYSRCIPDEGSLLLSAAAQRIPEVRLALSEVFRIGGLCCGVSESLSAGIVTVPAAGDCASLEDGVR